MADLPVPRSNLGAETGSDMLMFDVAVLACPAMKRSEEYVKKLEDAGVKALTHKRLEESCVSGSLQGKTDCYSGDEQRGHEGLLC